MVGQELELRGGVGPAVLALCYRAPVEWELEGRPLKVSGVAVALSWAPRWGLGRSAALVPSVGLQLERTGVQRLRLSPAAEHVVFDAAALLGLEARWQPWAGLGIGLQGRVAWSPTARTVVVPDGPRAKVGEWAVALQAAASWSFAAGMGR